MATYRLKRKSFSSENGEKKGMSTGAKLALGAAAVAGAGVAAHKGLLGKTAQGWAQKGVNAVKSKMPKFSKVDKSSVEATVTKKQPLQLENKPTKLLN